MGPEALRQAGRKDKLGVSSMDNVNGVDRSSDKDTDENKTKINEDALVYRSV